MLQDSSSLSRLSSPVSEGLALLQAAVEAYFPIAHSSDPRPAAVSALFQGVTTASLGGEIDFSLRSAFGRGLQLSHFSPGSFPQINQACDLFFSWLAALPSDQALDFLAQAPEFRSTGAPETVHDELCDYAHFVINRALIRHLVEALHVPVFQQVALTEASASMVVDHILKGNNPRIYETYLKALRQAVDQLDPQRPVVLFSFGCAEGGHDVRTVEALRGLYPRHTFGLIGYDPCATPQSNEIPKAGGVFIGTLMDPAVPFARVVADHFGPRAQTIVVERYAFHHASQSEASFIRQLGGDPFVGIDDLEHGDSFSLADRMVALANDLLVNVCFYKKSSQFQQDWFDFSHLTQTFMAMYRQARRPSGFRHTHLPAVAPVKTILTRNF